ncbi:MAG: RNA polymerase sigma factor [Aurantibacter sp.]
MGPKKVFDSFLVLQYQSGNKKALELLVNRHHKKLCRHAYWYIHDFDTAKDIVQDCWGTIINKLHGLRDPNSFGSWAMRIVTRKSLDFLSRDSKKRENLKQYSPISDQYDIEGNRTAEKQALKKAIDILPQDQQVVLRLFYTEDYSLKEIAAILDISVGTVKSRLFHAREKLKTILKR